MYYEAEIGAPHPGAPQVWQKLRRDWDASAPLVGLRRTRRAKVDQTGIEIDLRPAQRQDGLLAVTAVERDEDEKG
jgi:hypothetical protein